MTLVPHPPYSADLVPCDYLFQRMKINLRASFIPSKPLDYGTRSNRGEQNLVNMVYVEASSEDVISGSMWCQSIFIFWGRSFLFYWWTMFSDDIFHFPRVYEIHTMSIPKTSDHNFSRLWDSFFFFRTHTPDQTL